MNKKTLGTLPSIRRMAKYYNRSPEKISNDEIQQYLLHLIKDTPIQPVIAWCLQ